MLVRIWGAGSPSDSGSAFYLWLVILTALNGFSLVIDAIDVIRYAAGQHEPRVSV